MSQTLSATTLLIVPLAPLAGALLAGVFGTAFGGNLIGRRASHGLTILGVLIAFLLSASTLRDVVVHDARFNETLYTWMTIGSLKMEIGFLKNCLVLFWEMTIIVPFTLPGQQLVVIIHTHNNEI